MTAKIPHRHLFLPFALLAVSAACAASHGAVTLLGVQYQQDNPYAEYLDYWCLDRDYPDHCSSVAVGSNLHVYLRNDGASSVSIHDVTLAGYSLQTVIKSNPAQNSAASIYYYWDNPPSTILNTGEPVWYRADPIAIPASGVGQAIVRLRRVPVTGTVDVGVATSDGTIDATVPIDANAPQLASVSFSSDLMKVYLHWRRTGGAAPASISMDGTDITTNTVTAGDPNTNFAVSIVSLGTALTELSYHVFQGVYSDGKTATAGLRTRANPIMYGTWHSFEIGDYDYAAAAAWLDTCADRGINTLLFQASGGLVDYLQTAEGQQHAAANGYRFIINYYGKLACFDPLMWFLYDEPDIKENIILEDYCGTGLNLPCGSDPTGIKGMGIIAAGEALRGQADALTTVNMARTNMPTNFYAYGQAVDSLMLDSYYQRRVMNSYYHYPSTQELYRQATVIHASSLAGTRAAEPNPFNILLYSCEANPDGFDPWPFAPPETKRTEVYYALAGGAKGIGYWWFKPSNASNGLGDQADPNAQALWKEIGLLGAEIKTVMPLLAASHPVDLNVQGSSDVWVRALAAGTDTLILLAINDNLYNDDTGCHYTPVGNATVTLALPSWLASPSAFDVDAGGIGDVAAQLNGSQFQLNLGTLEVTRMVVVTKDPQLRMTIEQRYAQEVGPGVCNFAMDVCTQSIPPHITQHPQPSTICAGAAAEFAVGVVGSPPLTYQWQKNQANLSNGGHYSGVTTATLTIVGADAADDAGNYRCLVGNPHGNATSNAAALTVSACNANCLSNLGFENGFAGGAGTGWTKFIRAGGEGQYLSFSDETEEKHGGAHCQEVFSHDNQNDGGVYQRFTTTPGQPYVLKAWFKAFSPQGSGIAEGFLGLDPTGGTDPNSPNIVWVSKPYDYWSEKVWPVTAQTDYITVYLRGRSTKDPSKNKTAYVWIDDVELAPGAPLDDIPQAAGTTGIRWRWIDSAGETGYRVRDGAGADKSGLLPADTTHWTETGLIPNTQYTRRIHATNDCGESGGSVGQSAMTLSLAPEAGGITPSIRFPAVEESVTWTAVGGFGSGTVQYYRYMWNQNATHEWADSEPQWPSGTITTAPLARGTWYLHVQGYNAENVPNGTYDYALTTSPPPDLDRDGDVDHDDLVLFDLCFSGPAVAPTAGCEDRDFDDDTDVDQSDFGTFQRCYSGESNPADPECED